MIASFSTEDSLFFSTEKISPSIHQILSSTPYSLALCLAQASVAGSFSTAKIWSQRPDRAKAMVFPPAPAKASMRVVLWLDVEAPS